MKNDLGESWEVVRPERSWALMEQVGYSAEEIADLHSSGIAAVDLAALSEKGAVEILGSNPPNLTSVDANWGNYKPKKGTGKILLVDFYSGAVFRPLELTGFALFGEPGLAVPDPTGFPILPLSYRWRFNRIPAVLARSAAELKELAAAFARRDGRSHIVFRGQTKGYPILRKNRTGRLLYGDTVFHEPSLLTTAFRERFDYVRAERFWRAIIADIDYRLTGYSDKRWWVEDRIESIPVGDGDITRWHQVSTMAMAQHYGVPTYGLDVTQSIETAWWFATHRFHRSPEGSCYVPHGWGGMDLKDWPVIYILRTPTGSLISNLDLPATRPQKQEAVFAQGGWGAHGNLCADDLMALIVLAPEVGVAPGTAAEIFPNQEHDPMYKELLSLKRRLTPRHPLFQAAGLEYVFELSPESALKVADAL